MSAKRSEFVSLSRNTRWQKEVPPQSDSEGYVPYLYKYWFRSNKVRQYLGFIKRPKLVMDSLSCSDDSKILDVGCDWGYMVELLKSKGIDAYGIDINLGSLMFGGEIFNDSASLICGTAINLPFKDNSFSAIISLETMEHIHLEERKNFLLELKRCVREGGQIILTTPNIYGITEIGKQIIAKVPFLKENFGIKGKTIHSTHLDGFPKSQTMVNFPVSAQELKKIANSLNLKLIRQDNMIFVIRLCPEVCLGIAILIESVLERLPLVKTFGATSLYVFKKCE